ncbi:hypothetical protein A2196_02050 [Candidatus Curtissbacteria bacterium RIFOXYA1_FULL_41_14]|uniref:Zinc-ribbon domain-containing protein n=1 Tax=Candidatus Curtissbacteria bacterium RIFOXYA1_FULL_41_14 TaxID=1797737 RepID=A0A1F5HC40_9BACT|nr:MAG: hypothetical protein A2196_02050 [Candidatus Curtissbacteria bacterium RIFOXYA1_FULL_41_14]
MELQLTCPNCNKNILPTEYFCHQCGKKLKDKPPSTTFSRQLTVYVISFFLPPFGLWPAVRYLRQQDEKSKKIGLAAIFLTIISILLTIWLTTSFINSFNRELNNQLRFYKDVGY